MKTISIRLGQYLKRQSLLLSVLLLVSPIFLSAQSEEAAATEPEMISPSLEFIGVQKGDNSVDLKVSMKAKVSGNFIKLYFLKVNFYQVTDTAEKELGYAITDRNGKATFNASIDKLKLDKTGQLHFKVAYAGNKSIESASEEVTFSRARLELTPIKEDSLLSVQAKLVDLVTGKETPIKETTVGIFVQRSFYPMKIGEGATDENGVVTVEVPNNLPGDAKGNITLIGRLDESEIYGNLEAAVEQPWGIAVSDQNKQLPRALWSSHPPLWMLITFIILMTTVWGHYIVIVYELIRLRKEEPHNQVA